MPHRNHSNDKQVALHEADKLQEKLEAFMSKKLSPEEFSAFKKVMSSGDLKTHYDGSEFFKLPHYDLTEVASFIKDAVEEQQLAGKQTPWVFHTTWTYSR